MKFSLQTAALWITQLRCARSKIGQLRETTNGRGKEARSAAREPIRIETSFQEPTWKRRKADATFMKTQTS